MDATIIHEAFDFFLHNHVIYHAREILIDYAHLRKLINCIMFSINLSDSGRCRKSFEVESAHERIRSFLIYPCGSFHLTLFSYLSQDNLIDNFQINFHLNKFSCGETRTQQNTFI